MNVFRVSCLIGAVCSFVLTLFFLSWRGKKHASTVAFASFVFNSGVWNFSGFMFSSYPIASYDAAFFWWKVAYMGAIFAAASFLLFVVMYLELDRKFLVRTVFIMAAIFAFFNWYDKSRYFLGDLRFVFNQFYWIDALKYNNPMFFIFYLTLYWLVPGYCFLVMWRSFRNSVGDVRNKLKYIMLAAGFGWLGTNPLWLPAFHFNVYPYTNFLVALYPLPVAYVIVRHQVMDIEVVIKKTLVFTGLLASVFTMLVLPTLIIQEYLVRSAGIGGRFIGLTISGIIIILTVRRIESFLINVTDKYLFQKKYDYKELLKTFTTEVLTVLELDGLVNLTIDKLTDIIKLNSCAVLLFDDNKQEFRVMASNNIKDASVTLVRPNGVVTFMDETYGYILVKELKQKDISIPLSIQEIVDKLNAELIIPMVLHDKVIGVLSLGKKKSDEDYTQDDLDILLPLARTLAIAISNAELFDQLGKTQAEAAQKEKMAVIGTLSAGINHEICNPLGIARGQCEAFLLNIKDGLYRDKNSQELLQKAEQIMAKVIKETDRATAITKKLSSFAKPAKGESELVDIAKEVDEVFGLVGYELKLEKIEFDKRLGKDLPRIIVDRKQFQEVLFNLIRNAGQAIGEKGKVMVSAREESGRVIIDVQDTGSGIPENKIKELFNPFFTTKDPGKGTGLGLFIVRQIVEKNGGKIYLKRTKVGEGTTFTLDFPAAGTLPEGKNTKQENYETTNSRDR